MASTEALLISAVIRTGDWPVVIRSGVSHDMFTSCAAEWAYIEQYVTKRAQTPDKTMLKRKFPELPWYKTDDVEALCDDLKQDHGRRLMLEALDDATEMISRGDLDGASRAMSLGVAQSDVVRTVGGDEFDVFQSWEQTYSDVAARYERVAETGLAGVPTGFRSLDAATGGFQPGWLIFVAARLGAGKTWTLIKMATAASALGYDIGYFSLEQSAAQISMRVHSFISKRSDTQFDSASLMRGTGFDLEQYKKFMARMPAEANSRFLVDDNRRGRIGVRQIRAFLETKQPDVLFVDYLTLLDCPPDWQGITQLTGELKVIAEEYQTPIISAAQLGRSGVGLDPDNDDIAGSDSIGRDADGILMVTKDPKVEQLRRMKFTKFRHGPDGQRWVCEFRPGRGIFDEITQDKANQIADKELDED